MRRGVLALAIATALVIGGTAAGGEARGGGRLQGVVNGVTRDVFVGLGLSERRQRFHVPGSSLTVDGPSGGPRTFVSGVRDLGTKAPLRAGQLQPVGSNTKIATAILVMRLVQAHRIGLRQSVSSIAAANRRDGGVLARLAQRYHARLRGVDLRELLNHTSGLADCLDTRAFFSAFEAHPRGRYSLARLAGFGLRAPPVFKPGAPGRWNYSNTDYMLLGMILAAVTGRSVGDEMRGLFHDVGMRDSLYAPSLARLRSPTLRGRLVSGYLPGRKQIPLLRDAFPSLPRRVVRLRHPRAVRVVSSNPRESGPTVRVRRAGPRRTTLVERHRRFVFQDVTHAYSLSIARSAGGIVSNSRDLAKLWRALFDGRLVSRATLRKMERTVPTGENSPGVKTTWGLGFGHQRIARGVLWRGSPPIGVWYHLGDIFGYASAAYYVPRANLVVASTVDIFPQPVGDLGVLRDVLRAKLRRGR